MPADEFESTVEQLYAGPPGQFIAQRDAAVKRARAAGDKEVADQLKALRRPTVAAALLNQLHRRDGARLDELLELGEQLRAAQSKLDVASMKSLSAQRNSLVSQLTSEIADASDEPLSATVQEQLSDTLVAAVADAAAGRAVGSGRLVSGLRYSGFGDVDLQDAVAIPLRQPLEAPDDTPEDEPRAEETEDETARRQAQQQADAEQQLAAAADALTAAQKAEESAQQSAELAERALTAARRTAKATRTRAEQATAARSAAEQALAAAQELAAGTTES
ncbi:hypothetical protein [Flexivirga alba]|uniref:Transposase n=1 Tax=Flexivirga alba TaxID=702742 RepID=A0ABW2ADB8_9MICO